jgi:hypothetical protein
MVGQGQRRIDQQTDGLLHDDNWPLSIECYHFGSVLDHIGETPNWIDPSFFDLVVWKSRNFLV